MLLIRCDNQELLSKIDDMNAEMKAYIDKVQHLETLIGDKEPVFKYEIYCARLSKRCGLWFGCGF